LEAREEVLVWLGGEKPNRCGGGYPDMQFPPNHHSIYNPVNVVYQIPMQTVYGPGIQIPATHAATLDIDCDRIRGRILKYI
jgi:hypothetical protein